MVASTDLQNPINDQKVLNDDTLTLIYITHTYNNDIKSLNDGGLELRDGGRTLNYDIFYLILRPHTTNYEQNLVIDESLTLIDGGLTLIFGRKRERSMSKDTVGEWLAFP